MKTVTRRLRRLEDQIASVDRPRTLCSDGTLLEMVRFDKYNAGPDELTDEELDRWVESCPVQGHLVRAYWTARPPPLILGSAVRQPPEGLY